MGDSVMTCQASGLPIHKGDEAVVLFVTPSYKQMHHGGCYVYDMYKYSSFPIFITMDDYGGYGHYFCEENFCGKPRWDSKIKELEKQTAWKVFWAQLQTTRTNDQGRKPNHADWAAGLRYKKSGLWSPPVFSKNFDDGIMWTSMTYYRKDVWDWMIEGEKDKAKKRGDSEFEKELREKCSPIPPASSAKEDCESTMRRMGEIAWGNFLSIDMQMLLKMGKTRWGWEGKPVIDITLTRKEQEELINATIDMYWFTNALDLIGRPILPSVSTSPQGGFHNKYFRDYQKKFHKLCLDLIKKDYEKLDIDN